jgi:tetratricopeptide (TPR) repeat protein
MTNGTNYETVRDGLLELHRLFLAGQKKSPEVEAVRNATDEPWNELTEEEQELFTGLSIDLYEIEGIKRESSGLTEQQARAMIQDAYLAREAGEFDESLKLLRDCQEFSSDARGAYIRGTIWQRKGDPKVAAVFFKRAVDLEPTNSNFHAIWLHQLKSVDPSAAAVEAEKVLSNPAKFAPVAVVYAAEIAYIQTLPKSDPESTLVYRRLVPIMKHEIDRLRSMRPTPPKSLFGMGLSLLASCHEHLQEIPQAFDYYSEAIRLDPGNSTLYLARGKLLYGDDPAVAIEDLETAVTLKEPLVWPYLFLSHYYLGTGQYEKVLNLAAAGLALPSIGRVRSSLLEFRAIAEAQLEFPKNIVRRSFEEAIRNDISNQRALRNLEAFDKMTGRVSLDTWERPTASAVRRDAPSGAIYPSLAAA